MKWSSELARAAAWYANFSVNECVFEHSRPYLKMPVGYGENLASAFINVAYDDATPIRSISDVMNAWVESEQNLYNPDTKQCHPDDMCGHFTQVMWKASEWVGCATARSTACRGKAIDGWSVVIPNGSFYEVTVCEYVRFVGVALFD
jgi:pathogenesis-related protein 1